MNGYNCVVCIKQVPDTGKVTGQAMKADGTINRAALPAIFNPEDRNALEAALWVKETYGGTVTVITMGLPAAKAILREALMCGADRAVLVTDRKAAGSDTLATSYILSQAVRKFNPDLVFCGRQAIDGDTAQVGPGVSECLGLPLVTYVKRLEVSRNVGDSGGARYRVTTAMDDGDHVIEGTLPAVMTVVREAEPPRFAPLAGAMRAAKAAITELDEAAIGAEPERIGLGGSPTKVVRIAPPPVKGGGRKVEWNGDVETLARFLREAING